jgi:hypothetical protein
VLRPAPIRIEHQDVVGKETTWLRQQRAGWRTPGEVRSTWSDQDDLRERVLPILARMSERELRAAGVEPRTVRKIRARSGRGIRAKTMAKLFSGARQIRLENRSHRERDPE